MIKVYQIINNEKKFYGNFETFDGAKNFITKNNYKIQDNNEKYKILKQQFHDNIFNLIQDYIKKEDEFLLTIKNNKNLTKKERKKLSFDYIFLKKIKINKKQDLFENTIFWDKENNEIKNYENGKFLNLKIDDLEIWYIENVENYTYINTYFIID